MYGTDALKIYKYKVVGHKLGPNENQVVCLINVHRFELQTLRSRSQQFVAMKPDAYSILNSFGECKKLESKQTLYAWDIRDEREIVENCIERIEKRSSFVEIDNHILDWFASIEKVVGKTLCADFVKNLVCIEPVVWCV